jgi:hypothetical protein
MRFPKQHTSVAILCNVAQSMPTVRAYRVADVILANVLAPVSAADQKTDQKKDAAVAVPPDVLKGYSGIYKNSKDEYQRVEFKDGKLWLTDYGLELIPKSPIAFRTKLGAGTVSFSEKGMVFALVEENPSEFKKIETHAPQDLEQFTGEYYSGELDATWQLQAKGGHLTAHVKHSDSPAMPLLPVDDNTFTLEGGSLRFEPGVKRAFLTVSRIRNIEFVKQNSSSPR